jgi:hypothetical protein
MAATATTTQESAGGQPAGKSTTPRPGPPPPVQHSPETYAYLVGVLTEFLMTAGPLLKEAEHGDRNESSHSTPYG